MPRRRQISDQLPVASNTNTGASYLPRARTDSDANAEADIGVPSAPIVDDVPSAPNVDDVPSATVVDYDVPSATDNDIDVPNAPQPVVYTARHIFPNASNQYTGSSELEVDSSDRDDQYSDIDFPDAADSGRDDDLDGDGDTQLRTPHLHPLDDDIDMDMDMETQLNRPPSESFTLIRPPDEDLSESAQDYLAFDAREGRSPGDSGDEVDSESLVDEFERAQFGELFGDAEGPGTDDNSDHETLDGEEDESSTLRSFNLDDEQQLVDAFEYGLAPVMSSAELLQVLLYKIKCDGNVSLSVHQLYCDVIGSFTSAGATPDRRNVDSCRRDPRPLRCRRSILPHTRRISSG